MYHLELVTSECLNSSTPLELSITSATVSSLLLLITIPTNLLVCLAILIDPNNELKTQFNCFTFNLALADLLVGCITESVSVYAHVTEALNTEHKQEVNPVVLRLFHIPYFISAMASVLSIAALALERYLAIVAPFRYRQYFSVQLAVVMSVAIWIMSVSFGLVNLLADYILESFIFVNSGVLFTCFVVCFASFKIRLNIRQVSRNLVKIGGQKVGLSGQNTTESKLTKTFALIIGALMCCYIPACSLIYYMNLCQKCDCDLIQWFRDAAFWLILLNSAINPLIYAIRSSSFRNAIKDIVCCKCRKNKRRAYVIAYTKRTYRQRLDPTTGHTKYGSVSTETESETGDCERLRLI